MRALTAVTFVLLPLTTLAAIGHGCSNTVEVITSSSSSTPGGEGGGSGGRATATGGWDAITSSSSMTNPSGSGGTAGTDETDAAPSSSAGGTGGCGQAPSVCQGHIYQCGDLVDNDGDGLIDSEDPECIGPCDNTEESYYGAIPGQSGSPCTADCYFDQDTGSGNDDCFWNHHCDPHEVPPNYYPEHQLVSACAYNPTTSIPGTAATCAALYAAQSHVCHDFCDPLTPNGCDCFGCCELPAGSGKYVWLGSEDGSRIGSCTSDAAGDPAKCAPCEPVPSCLNPCDPCELCIGKRTVAPGCAETEQCAPGIKPCGLPSQGCCPHGQYCISGCCQAGPM
jgi:hypothetical protein